MRELPLQLAQLSGDVRLESAVESIRPGAGEVTVTTTSGQSLSVRRVVLATDAPAAARLLGRPEPAMRGVVTAWFAADDAPSSRLLHVDARERPRGPVVNTAVVSAAAPSYAPAGRHLVQASALLPAGGGGPGTAALRQHAAELLDTRSDDWEVVAVHEVPHALPAQAPPFRTRRPVRADRGVYLCGDHQDTASIQGALVSGRRTARKVLVDLSA
jgi:predicted NAD/FAD-dependent oxidoreductase